MLQGKVNMTGGVSKSVPDISSKGHSTVSRHKRLTTWLFLHDPVMLVAIATPVLLLIVSAASLFYLQIKIQQQDDLIKQLTREQVIVGQLLVQLSTQDAAWQNYVASFGEPEQVLQWQKFKEIQPQTREIANFLLLAVQSDEEHQEIRSFITSLEALWIAYQESRSKLLSGEFSHYEATGYSEGLAGISQLALVEISSSINQRVSNHSKNIISQANQILFYSLLIVVFIGLPLVIISLWFVRQILLHRKQAFTRLNWLADHDAITNLPIRHLWAKKVDSQLRDNGDRGITALVTITNLRAINQSHGRSVQEGFLRSIAEILQSLPGKNLQFSRIVGSDFVIFCGDVENSRDWIAALETQLAKSITMEGFVHRLEYRVGVYVHDQSGLTAESAIGRAEIALLSNTSNRINFYQHEQIQRLQRKTELLAALRFALQKQNFQLVYQPQVWSGSEKLMGVEALLRWQLPDGSFVSPAEFIPMAEEMGLMPEIGSWVLNTGIAQFSAWQKANLAIGKISLNISTQQLIEKDFCQQLIHLLKKYEVEPKCIVLELTESIYALEHRDVLASVKALGCQLSIDDFGTGFSNLGYLVDMAPDVIKIDRRFVQNIHLNERKGTLVANMIDLASKLGALAVAEGVELAEEYRCLKDLGCSAIQGFYSSKPLSNDDLLLFFNDQK
ncbi:bifunctional diguanylate cyclase/phosphodiesterase [Simiduia curdlanivorans]|uniref:Bifunctional diguanylate cyclase/phosphodiesterase n=1 Tax=Simiduia curdlanivorans TaxID=1492769 RepID=A0ABV8UZT2_9GAMM|nr:bifunctional diguanylate cyclase/phosphodiesterase [Simiduia curdlanivorans]MDN3639183.1 bifunctional diguanylate cyclase/phosphodiesterase [Simiduia curdlanivorans]